MADGTQLKSLQEKIENIESELLYLRANASKNRLELNQKITKMQQKLDENTQELSQQTQMLHKIIGILTSLQLQTPKPVNSQSNQTFNTNTNTTNITNSQPNIPNSLFKDMQPPATSLFQQQKATTNPNDVSLTLAKHILKTERNEGDFVFSPISIQFLLSLVAVGSKGSTRDQLMTFLKVNSVDHLIESSFEILSNVFADGSGRGGPKLSFANGAWVDRCYGLKQSFKRILETAFKAETSQHDFQSRAVEATNDVNAWVQKATNGLIKDLIPLGSINSDTRLVLANALYFKGDWDQKFNSSFTQEERFYLLNGSNIRVPFMRSWDKQFVAAFDDFKVLRLPYRQGLDKRNFSMYIFLPNAKDGLAALVEKMGTELGFLDRYLPRLQVEIGCLAIPKFKILFDYEASKALKELGLSSLFSNDGDLSEMVEYSFISENLSVSTIHHKSLIDVNEEGTKAAASSAAILYGAAMSSSTLKKIYFVADHPFLFMIREDMSGVVLFIGQVLRPL